MSQPFGFGLGGLEIARGCVRQRLRGCVKGVVRSGLYDAAEEVTFCGHSERIKRDSTAMWIRSVPSLELSVKTLKR